MHHLSPLSKDVVQISRSSLSSELGVLSPDKSKASQSSCCFVHFCGLRLLVPAGHFDEQVLLTGGLPEAHMMSLFERLNPTGWTVLDVGANIGTHTVKLSTLVGPSGRVFAVEADIDNAAVIRRTLVENDLQNVSLMNVAASDRPCLLYLVESHSTNSVFSNLGDSTSSKVAAAMPIDALISDEVDLIKVDIEGAELTALEGMRNLIGRSRPLVLVEFSPAYIQRMFGVDRSLELLKFFSRRDYSCFHLQFNSEVVHIAAASEVLCLYETERSQGWHHVDLLFVPSEKCGPCQWTLPGGTLRVRANVNPALTMD